MDHKKIINHDINHTTYPVCACLLTILQGLHSWKVQMQSINYELEAKQRWSHLKKVKEKDLLTQNAEG